MYPHPLTCLCSSLFLLALPLQAQDVANGIFGLGKLQSSSFSSSSSPLTVARCLDALLRQLPIMKDAELSMALQGMGLLGAHPSAAVSTRLADALSARLPSLSPQMAVTSLNGLAKMGHLPSEDTWQQWNGVLSPSLGAYKPQELVTLIRACAHMRGKGAAVEAVEMLVLRALDHAQRKLQVRLPLIYMNRAGGWGEYPTGWRAEGCETRLMLAG